MTTNTEALREQFELYVNPEGDIKLHRLVDGSYAGHGLNLTQTRPNKRRVRRGRLR